MSGDLLAFAAVARQDFVWWLANDFRTARKILNLAEDALRHPETGLGKPERLKGYNGYWSRRIDDKNRLVYRVSDTGILIVQCRGHYDDH